MSIGVVFNSLLPSKLFVTIRNSYFVVGWVGNFSFNNRISDLLAFFVRMKFNEKQEIESSTPSR
ncbi:MAG: hypothetical protein IPH02_16695 [Sphingobacteriales bacterium]|nr:hypothetical protein [Sphingobacteriales bacterium]